MRTTTRSRVSWPSHARATRLHAVVASTHVCGRIMRDATAARSRSRARRSSRVCCCTASRTRADLWRHQIPTLSTVGLPRHRARPARLRRLRQAGRRRRLPRRHERRRRGRDPRRAGHRAGARRRPRLGRRRRLGVRAARRPSAWTVSSCCPSAIPGVARPTSPQREKSWYMLLFQFAGGGGAPAPGRLGAAARVGRDASRARRACIADLQRPGALTAGLNWYRANRHPRRELDPPRDLPPVTAPTARRLEHGRRLPHRGADDRARPRYVTDLALRAHRRRGPLDAARPAGRGQRAAKKPPVLSAVSLRAAFAARDLSPVEVLDAFEELPESARSSRSRSSGRARRPSAPSRPTRTAPRVRWKG